MKIISKYKDYYDYLIGQYGIDTAVFYDRQISEANCTGVNIQNLRISDIFPKENYVYALAICGKIYSGAYYNNKFYFGDNIILNDIPVVSDEYKTKWRNTNNYPYLEFDKVRDLNKFYYLLNGRDTDLNDIYNSPVILIGTYGRNGNYGNKGYNEIINIENLEYRYSAGLLNPILKQYGIDKIINANDMYVMIYNFLIREKNIANNQTDIEKVSTHGFDTKYGFRTRKL